MKRNLAIPFSIHSFSNSAVIYKKILGQERHCTPIMGQEKNSHATSFLYSTGGWSFIFYNMLYIKIETIEKIKRINKIKIIIFFHCSSPLFFV